jgi:hypothetical protein
MSERQNPQTLLKLRIELLYTDPLIWRRVLVPDTITLVKLHAVIQESMGWWDSHLHEFDIAGRRYGMTDPEWDVDPELIDEAGKKLLNVLVDQKQFDYLYDFGDSWLHRIMLEKRLPMIEQITLDNIIPGIEPQRYAMCVDGENACPPEDVGGVPGYSNFLDIISNPDHEEYDEMIEWWGGSFDPEFFDIDTANKNLKRIKL